MSRFTKNYFLRGVETGQSNYTDYRWLPRQTLPATARMLAFLGIKDASTILDYGCARGYYVRAMRVLGHQAYGFDTSEWAVKNADATVKKFVSRTLGPRTYQYVVCKDVLEHVAPSCLPRVLRAIASRTSVKALLIVPLAENGKYLNPVDELDRTHRLRWGMERWLKTIQQHVGAQCVVSGAYRLPGVKEAAAPDSTAFITIHTHYEHTINCHVRQCLQRRPRPARAPGIERPLL